MYATISTRCKFNCRHITCLGVLKGLLLDGSYAKRRCNSWNYILLSLSAKPFRLTKKVPWNKLFKEFGYRLVDDVKSKACCTVKREYFVERRVQCK